MIFKLYFILMKINYVGKMNVIKIKRTKKTVNV